MSADGLRHLQDRDLLLLIAKREADALEVVYDRHIAPVWKLALITCSGEANAEKAVCETFRELWRRPEPDITDRSLAVRLLSSVQRSCAGKQRRGRRRRFATRFANAS